MQKTVLTLSLMLAACGLSLLAQAPPTTPAPSTNQAPPANADTQIHATLNQLMRGILYPAANVVFSAQNDEDPGNLKFIPGHDPVMSTDPLYSSFGGWTAIENAALALAESGNLLMIPGRMCSSGAPAPTKDPAWGKFVQDVRDVSLKAYAAAQAKDQKKLTDLSESLSKSCEGCHRKWRDRRGGPGNRCK